MSDGADWAMRTPRRSLVIPGLLAAQPPWIGFAAAADAGIAFTRMDAAGDDLADSDVHAWGDDYGFSDPIVIPPNLVSTSAYDVGLLVQEVPEPGAAGAAAALLALGFGAARPRSPR